MMNLERLFELVLSNPTNISIQYQNINGEEKLTVNGEDLTPKLESKFDDSRVKQLISSYQENIEHLDDCVFVETMEEVAETIDIKELDRLLNQESFTEEEATDVESCIGFINATIHEKLTNKIQQLVETLEKF